MEQTTKRPKIGFLYLDYVLRFFNHTNFKGWPDKIESVVYHWKNDAHRFIEEVKQKKIDVLIGNIPATAYDTFVEIAKELPHVRFIPSIPTQFANKSKENVTLFCRHNNLPHPKTEIFYDREKADTYLKSCQYPKIIKRSYGPSNYGGYYVHKVDNYQETKTLLDKKKYMPVYIQDCVPIKRDLRIMLVGHRPVCAFWRIAGKDKDITNTSQGGSISYEDVPKEALDVAVKASKAACAEYYACDIAESDGQYVILECCTAFAAFSYIRDWIGEYIMWDLSNGKTRKPHIPLYHWEDFGKLSPFILRSLRYLYFSRTPQRATKDGEEIDIQQIADLYEMERVDLAHISEVPLEFNVPFNVENKLIEEEHKLPEQIKVAETLQPEDTTPLQTISDPTALSDITLTELMTLPKMTTELAENIMQSIQSKAIQSLGDLLNQFAPDKESADIWRKNLSD